MTEDTKVKCSSCKRENTNPGFKTCDKCRASTRKYYASNRQQEIKRQKDKNETIIQKIADYKSARGCCVAECRINDSEILDLHHNSDNKEDNISSMVRHKGWATILREMEKCVVICANHHRKLHADLRREKKLKECTTLDSENEPTESEATDTDKQIIH